MDAPRLRFAAGLLQQIVPTRHTTEVAVDGARPGAQCRWIDRLHAERPAHRLPIARCVDQQAGADSHRFVWPGPRDMPAALLVAERVHLEPIEICDARRDGAPDQVRIKVGAQPVRVGVHVVRARGDKQGVVVSLARRVALAPLVVEEAEAALQAAANLRIGRLPGAVLGEGFQPIETEAIGDGGELEVGQRRRRFADGETRMAAALQQRDGEPEPLGDDRQQRAAEAGAEDSQVAVDAGHGFVSTEDKCSTVMTARVLLLRYQPCNGLDTDGLNVPPLIEAALLGEPQLATVDGSDVAWVRLP